MATADFKLKGVDKFMRNFQQEVRGLKGRTLAGLIDAVIELQREAEPATPIDLGNLRASWFTVSVNGEEETSIDIVQFKGEDATSMKANHARVTQAAQSAIKSMSKAFRPVVMFGYTANYAVFVHENVDATFQRPGAKARWLYQAMQDARSRMLQRIADRARF
jgi:hypothetical protein